MGYVGNIEDQPRAEQLRRLTEISDVLVRVVRNAPSRISVNELVGVVSKAMGIPDKQVRLGVDFALHQRKLLYDPNRWFLILPR